MDFFPSFMVGACAILVSGVIFLVQRYTQAKYGFKEKQAMMKEKQELIKVIYQTKDPKDPIVIKEINDMQKEMMDISMEMMKTSFKNMLWIMLFSLLIFVYIANFMSSSLPVGSFLGINAVFVWYIIISICANILFKLAFTILEKKGIIKDTY